MTGTNATPESDSLTDLVGDWLPLPDAAERLDLQVTKVHRLIDDGTLLALRVGEPPVRSVPAAFLTEDGPVDSLRGTISVLRDAGFSDDEALRWLFTFDESLPGRPIDALRTGRKTEIRRRAQALAW
ncbi:DNA-binding protein [Tersicoccus phoenicis]|uniref:DNA-binding protein n=1 Tax=Tersicoccus phoenicis TaxID=554083 RepID=A0A1R1L9T2_9MICC|nr:Rv2175c family DNA-binding protein [Tersicoccus phoenicis]OMH24287.1 DNA-binding protein [Tersicoccus phoenicis]